MKKICWLIALVVLFVSAGCFDTVDEMTINDNGSGVLLTRLDMGKMLGVLTAMGGDEKIKEAEKMKIDTTVFLKDIKDSIAGLTDAERKLLEKGKASFVLDVKDEKFSISFSLPFAKPSEIPAINDVLKKSKGKMGAVLMEKIRPADAKPNDKDMPQMERDGAPDISSYFETSYAANKLTRKVNKEKFAKAGDDESLKSLKEMGQMGMPLSFKTVFNLPKPAKKATGKGVTLSDDKKTVIIQGTLEDFFEDPSTFEYEIEY